MRRLLLAVAGLCEAAYGGQREPEPGVANTGQSGLLSI